MMRSSEKDMNVQSMDGRLFGVDFHDFIQKEQNSTSFELASEFGLTIERCQKVKKTFGEIVISLDIIGVAPYYYINKLIF